MFGHHISMEEPKKQEQSPATISPEEAAKLKKQVEELQLRNRQLERLNAEINRERERQARERQADRERESRVRTIVAQNSRMSSWE